MAKTEISISYISELKPFQIAEDPKVKAKFIENAARCAKDTDPEEFYEQEKYYFNKILLEKNGGDKPITACTPFSLYCSFMDVVLLNVSFDPSAKLLYLMQRGFPSGRKDSEGKEIWENRAYNELSPYGELAQRIQAGQIRHVDPVVIVYEGDTWKLSAREDKTSIIWEAIIPRSSKTITGSWMKTTRGDGSIFYSWMLKEEIDRLAAASKRSNSNKYKEGIANALYTSVNGGIDPGFLAAKTLKHSFKTLPKLKMMSMNTELAEFPDTVEPLVETNPLAGSPDLPSMKPEQNNGAAAPVQDANNIGGTSDITADPNEIDLRLDF